MTIDWDVNEGLLEAFGLSAGKVAAAVEHYALQVASLSGYETEIRLGYHDDTAKTRETAAWLRREARAAQSAMIEAMCEGTLAKVEYERRYWVAAD